jgi:hypothetical protein
MWLFSPLFFFSPLVFLLNVFIAFLGFGRFVTRGIKKRENIFVKKSIQGGAWERKKK